ncbi:FHA domain-containing protein [Nocardia sp. NPDC048505]|uniref:FHA domain-containing protein n=1 Tax=unclassified Nocardia TaxID=2637762 RepID=UPI00340DBA0C
MVKNPSTVGIAPGEGLIARFGEVVIYLGGETAATDRILGAIEAVAAGDHPGAAIVQRLAAVIFVGGSEPPPFGLVAPTSDGTVILLRGPLIAEIQGAEGTRRLSGARAFTWVDEIVREPIRRISVSGNIDMPVHPRSNLGDGIVPGGGFEFRIGLRRAGKRPAQRTAPKPRTPEPAQTMPAGFDALDAYDEPTVPDRTDAPRRSRAALDTGRAPSPAEGGNPGQAPDPALGRTTGNNRSASPGHASDSGRNRTIGTGSERTPDSAPYQVAASASGRTPAGVGDFPDRVAQGERPDTRAAEPALAADSDARGDLTETSGPHVSPATSADRAVTSSANRASISPGDHAAASSPGRAPTSAAEHAATSSPSRPSATPAEGTPGTAPASSAEQTDTPGPGRSPADRPVLSKSSTSRRKPADSGGAETLGFDAADDSARSPATGLERVENRAPSDRAEISGPGRAPRRPADLAAADGPTAKSEGGRAEPASTAAMPKAWSQVPDSDPVVPQPNPLPEPPRPPAAPPTGRGSSTGALVFGDSTYPLDRPYVLGRSPSADDSVRTRAAAPLQVPRDRHVSRVHAYVTPERGKVFVRDAGTPAGTFIAAPGAEQWTRIGAAATELPPGWSIRIGERIVTYRAAERRSAVPKILQKRR